MLVILLSLWPISGWLCGYFATEKWMLKDDPFGWVVIFVCGAIVGPFGALWFLDRQRDTSL
jgi:hypothetical protein